jgi:hypothetical protein
LAVAFGFDCGAEFAAGTATKIATAATANREVVKRIRRIG